MDESGIDLQVFSLALKDHASAAREFERTIQQLGFRGALLVEAWFTYNAAPRPAMLPRIPTPEPLTK